MSSIVQATGLIVQQDLESHKKFNCRIQDALKSNSIPDFETSTGLHETFLTHTSILSQGKLLVSRCSITYILTSYHQKHEKFIKEKIKQWSNNTASQAFWNEFFINFYWLLTIFASWVHYIIQNVLLQYCPWDCTWSLFTRVNRLIWHCRGLCGGSQIRQSLKDILAI